MPTIIIKTFDDIPTAPLTLMEPARKIYAKHREHRKNQDAKFIALANVAEQLQKDGTVQYTPEQLKAIAYAPGENTGRVLAETSAMIGYDADEKMNITDVTSRLIRETGRYCDRYASDLVISLMDVYAFESANTAPCPQEGESLDYLVPIGLRSDGCDGIGFLMPRLRDTRRFPHDYVYPEKVYRKLLGVYVLDEYAMPGRIDRTVALLDITHDVYQLHETDEIQT